MIGPAMTRRNIPANLVHPLVEPQQRGILGKDQGEDLGNIPPNSTCYQYVRMNVTKVRQTDGDFLASSKTKQNFLKRFPHRHLAASGHTTTHMDFLAEMCSISGFGNKWTSFWLPRRYTCCFEIPDDTTRIPKRSLLLLFFLFLL